MADRTLSAALTIDAAALDSISEYEKRLAQLDATIDAFTASASARFADLGKSIQTSIPKQMSIRLDVTGNAMSRLQEIAKAVERMGHSSLFGDEGAWAMMQESAVNRQIEESLGKRAITYKEITDRIKELNIAQERLLEIESTAPNGFQLSERSLENFVKAKEQVDALTRRLHDLGIVYDEVKAKTDLPAALNLPEGNLEEIHRKMEALRDVRNEFLKPGPATDEDARTAGLAAVDKALDELLPKYRTAAEAAARAAKAERELARERQKAEQTEATRGNAKSNLQKSLELEEKSVEQLREKIRAVSRALAEYRKALGQPIGGNSLTKSTENELDRLRLKLREARGETIRLGNTADSVGRLMTRAFSVYQVSALARSVVDIYGRFQLMERSLGVIIKDANRAREIFADIQKMAVRSPFQVTDLSDYTRQLAAFRFGVDELLPMTSKLADISAGLGVEMGRLILATGQVRAANYLKLTEVRQFTEAGVDLLGALAERFSEIENRAVSVGEVMQRITKRMVTFQDVDAVLTRMTSVGGTFYRMQEAQAETVFGLVSNLRDRWEIALNRMGKDTDGFINGVIQGLISVLNNASTLSSVLQSAFWGYAVGAGINLLIKGFVSVRNVILNAKEAMRLFEKGWSAMGLKALTANLGTLTFGIGAVAAALTFAILKIREAGRLNRELSDIARRHGDELSDLTRKYTVLSSRVASSSLSLRERKQALEELRSEYGAILPLEDANLNNVEALTASYSAHIQMLRQYIAAKSAEAQTLAIIEDLNDRGAQSAARFADKLTDIIAGATARRTGERPSFTSINQDLRRFYEIIGDEILAGDEQWLVAIDAGNDALRQRLRERLNEYFNIELYEHQLDAFSTGLIRRFGEAFDRIASVTAGTRYLQVDTKEIEDSIDSLKRDYEKTLADLTVAPDFEGNRAGAILSAQNWLSSRIEGIRGQISGLFDDGTISQEMRRQLERMLNGAASALDLSRTGEILQSKFDEINRRYPLLPKPIGEAETEWGGTPDMAGYAKAVSAARETLLGEIESLRQAQADADAGLEGASERLELLRSTAAIPDLSEARRQLAAYDELLTMLKPYLEGKPAQDARVAAEKAARELQRSLEELGKGIVEQYSVLDEASPDEISARWKKLSSLAASIHITLPDPKDLSRDTVDKWIDTVLAPRTEDLSVIADLKIKLSEESAERAVEALNVEVSRIKRQIDLAGRFEQIGIEVPGFNLARLYTDLESAAQRYEAIGTGSARAKAKELGDYLISIHTDAHLQALKAISDLNRKSSDSISRLFIDYRRSMESLNVNYSGPETLLPEIDTQAVDEAKLNATRKLFTDIADEMYEAYKGTEMYIRSFGDLENVSLPVLTQLREQLAAVAGSQRQLEASDAKAVAQTLEKLDALIVERSFQSSSFLETVVKGLDEVIDVNRRAQEAFAATETAKSAYLKERAHLDELMASAISSPETTGIDDVERQTEAVTEAQSRYNDALAHYFALLRQAENISKTYRGRLEGISKSISSVGSAVSSASRLLSGLAEGFGTALGSDTEAAIESLERSFSLVGEAVSIATTATAAFELLLASTDATAKSLMTTFLPLLAVALALGAAMAIVNAADNKREREIERQLEMVEELRRNYDRLSDAMSQAMSIERLRSYNADLENNLRLQQLALEYAIQVEESRGAKRDEDNLKTMRDDLAELNDAAKELHESYFESLGVESNWRGMASDFAREWLEAFRTTGDGLTALRGSFDGFLDGILVEQFALRSVAPLLEDFRNQVEAWLTDDSLLDASEMEAYRQLRDSLSALMNSQMEELNSALGLTGGGAGSVETSALQKGIQALTEDTGQALESVLNSVRFYVAELSETTSRALSILSTDGGDGPLMSELKAQTALLRAVNDSVTSVIRSGHRLDGGAGIRVFMD